MKLHQALPFPNSCSTCGGHTHSKKPVSNGVRWVKAKNFGLRHVPNLEELGFKVLVEVLGP